jgi:hypothetical protein
MEIKIGKHAFKTRSKWESKVSSAIGWRAVSGEQGENFVTKCE